MAVDSNLPASSSSTKLGLGGTTINAMALIAPGAFLWTTFQLQAQAKTDGGGNAISTMWFGLLLAVGICFLTAIAYSEMAKLYPGPGSSYLFAEQAFLNHEISSRYARISKFVVGLASHLYYWIYPAVMVAMMGNLVGYIIGSLTNGKLFDPASPPLWLVGVTAVIFTLVVAYICYRGVQGSTSVNLVINIIQIISLILVSILFFVFRLRHPELQWHHATWLSVALPHSTAAVMSQATIAILLVVGFESVTSLGDEVHNPKRTIPMAVILSLAIQGLFCYLLEYFAANLVLVEGGSKTLKYGMTEAAASAAPIGDMLKMIGGDVFGEAAGFILMIVVAATVFIALVGTTIACMNTGSRVTYAMGKDDDSPIPTNLGVLHGKTLTPYMSLMVLTIITCLVGFYASWFSQCGSAITLTDTSTAAVKAQAAIPNGLLTITYLSNFGTFALYGMTCFLTLMAYAKRDDRNILKHMIIPFCGAFLNFFLMYKYISMGPEAVVAFKVAAGFGILGLVYMFVWHGATGVSVLHPGKAKSSS